MLVCMCALEEKGGGSMCGRVHAHAFTTHMHIFYILAGK